MAISTDSIIGLHPVTVNQLTDGRMDSLTATNKLIASASGAVTQNSLAGRVQIAAAGSSVVLTNSFIGLNSIVLLTVATNDTTAKSAAVVVAAGSATITLSAAATAITTVNYLVIN